MRILLFGATGKTGRQVLMQGLRLGHHITAFARNPAALSIKDKQLTVVRGNILELQEVKDAAKGHDVVISVLGNKTSNAFWHSNTTISDGLRNIIQAMIVHKVKRLLFVSSFGVSNTIFLPEKLFIRVVLKNIFADIPKQEKMIVDSGLNYTIVRPTRLIDAARTGEYKAGVDLPIGLFSKISRSDVADFLLKNIENKKVAQKIITLSY